MDTDRRDRDAMLAARVNAGRGAFLVAVTFACLFLQPDWLAAEEGLAKWQERQAKIKQVIQRAFPSVIAIGGGTGVIVTSEGHVLTVSHVAGKAGRQMKVRLPGGGQVTATTLGGDPNSDAAVMKLDSPGPWPVVGVPGLSVGQSGTEQPLPSGPNGDLEIGRWCLAFGYPLSFKRGAPAVARLGQITEVDANRLTASSTIMGGDSGGPLFDLDGRLIGIASRVKAAVGANLFVPIETYRQYWPALLIGDPVVNSKFAEGGDLAARPWLGVFGDTDQKLVRLRKVQQGSPAEAAGLQAEDVVLSINGTDVTAFSEVVEILQTLKQKDVVALRVNRFGRPLDIRVALGIRP